MSGGRHARDRRTRSDPRTSLKTRSLHAMCDDTNADDDAIATQHTGTRIDCGLDISILPREAQAGLTFEKFVLSHFTGREGGMTTVWRPRVRIPVPDIDGADADENRRDESTKKGTKRKKRAPPTKGPCEHGVKYRSNCKVCSACPHGRRRLECKECGGSSICEHGRERSHARSAVGGNMRARSSALSVQGVRWEGNMRARSSALSVQGVRWEGNMRARSSALSMQGVRWVTNLRARSSRSLQGVRWG